MEWPRRQHAPGRGALWRLPCSEWPRMGPFPRHCRPNVNYHPIYHPFNWRGWTDWGVGAIGDMGAHLIDTAFWSLDLDYPTSVETRSTPFNHQSYPMSSVTDYVFPAKGARPAVKLTWYDGGLTPPKPVEMGEEELNKGGGVLYIGTKGKLMHDTYGFN